jgi:hypothetical protein
VIRAQNSFVLEVSLEKFGKQKQKLALVFVVREPLAILRELKGVLGDKLSYFSVETVQEIL